MKKSRFVPCVLISWEKSPKPAKRYFGFLCDTRHEAVHKSVATMYKEKMDEGVLTQVEMGDLITLSLGESLKKSVIDKCKKLCVIKKNDQQKMNVTHL